MATATPAIEKSSRSRLKKLDELVREAAKLLPSTQSGWASVKAPWLLYPERVDVGSIDEILQGDGRRGVLFGDVKTAIVYAAYPNDPEKRIRKVGEALFLASMTMHLSHSAIEALEHMPSEIDRLGYKPLHTNEISAHVAKDADIGPERQAKLRERLLTEAKKQIPGIRTFYTASGPQSFVQKSQETTLSQLSGIARGLLPEYLAKDGYKEVTHFSADHSERSRKLQQWIIESLRSGNLTEVLETLDGEREYVPPGLSQKATETALKVKEARVPQLIEATGAQRLEAAVQHALGKRQSSDRAAYLMKAICSQAETGFGGHVGLRETTEGPIWYVSKEGAKLVTQYVKQNAATQHNPSGLLRLVGHVLPFLRQQPEGQRTEPEHTNPELHKAYNNRLYELALQLAYNDKSPFAVVVAASSRFRLDVFPIEEKKWPNTGRVNHKQQNQLWKSIKYAVRAYEANVPAHLPLESTQAMQIIRSDASKLELLTRTILSMVTPEIRGQIDREVGRFRQMYGIEPSASKS